MDVWRPMRRWWRDERGATSIEYAVIASLIAVSIVGVLQVLGPQKVFGLYNALATGMTAAGL